MCMMVVNAKLKKLAMWAGDQIADMKCFREASDFLHTSAFIMTLNIFT